MACCALRQPRIRLSVTHLLSAPHMPVVIFLSLFCCALAVMLQRWEQQEAPARRAAEELEPVLVELLLDKGWKALSNTTEWPLGSGSFGVIHIGRIDDGTLVGHLRNTTS